MGLFSKGKTREERLKDRFDDLTKDTEPYAGKLCMIGTYMFRFKGFIIDGEDIRIQFCDTNTPDGFVTTMLEDRFYCAYQTSIKQARINFIKVQKDFKFFGYELKSIQDEEGCTKTV